MGHTLPVIIREGTEADIAAAVAIHRRSYTASDKLQKVAPDGLEGERLAFQPEMMTHYFNHFSSSSAWDARAAFRVAVSEGKVVGFLCTKTAEETFANYGAIDSLYVDPDYWRCGIGEQLLGDGLRLLRERGVERAMLWAGEADRIAAGFYESHGWRRRDDQVRQYPEARVKSFVMYEHS